jgi:hypothetical protein
MATRLPRISNNSGVISVVCELIVSRLWSSSPVRSIAPPLEFGLADLAWIGRKHPDSPVQCAAMPREKTPFTLLARRFAYCVRGSSLCLLRATSGKG